MYVMNKIRKFPLRKEVRLNKKHLTALALIAEAGYGNDPSDVIRRLIIEKAAQLHTSKLKLSNDLHLRTH